MAQADASAEELYESDFHAWLMSQAGKLRVRAHNEIDWDNLAEEVESVARSQRREIRSRLALLIQHLLKWEIQPGRRSESWRITIGEQRTFIPGIIEDSPSLRPFLAEIFDKSYSAGRAKAIEETGLSARAFPAEPPYTIEQVLDDGFFPGVALENWATLRD